MSREDDAVNEALDAYVDATGGAPDAAVVEAMEAAAEWLTDEEDEQ